MFNKSKREILIFVFILVTLIMGITFSSRFGPGIKVKFHFFTILGFSINLF